MFQIQNKRIFLFTMLFVMAFFVVQRNHIVDAEAGESLGYKLSGKILLQVEQSGEAWYVNPDNAERYYMGRPNDAFTLMRELGLGISEEDFERLIAKNNYVAPKKLSGKIVLRVFAKGEAYYINPKDLTAHYLGRPKDAFKIMQELGFGIMDTDLEKIEINKNSITVANNPNLESAKCKVGEIEENGKCVEDTSCNQKHFKMAFVLLESEKTPATQKNINDIRLAKEAFADVFHKATLYQATMDTSDDVYIIRIEEKDLPTSNITWFDETNPSVKLSRMFYEKFNNDTYDFVSFYNTFNDGSASHLTVKNDIAGIGKGYYAAGELKPYSDHTKLFGSNGKLKGINKLGVLELTNFYQKTSAAGLLFHETGHQWCCSVGDGFNKGRDNEKLEIRTKSGHWYPGLESPKNTTDNLGTHIWLRNENGTFRYAMGYEKKDLGISLEYHPFLLYFMGLASPEEYDTKYKVYDVGGAEGEEIDWENNNHTLYSEVSINDIISVEGKRMCLRVE